MAKSAKARRRAYNRAYYRTKKAYKAYVKLYQSRERMLESKGYSMYDEMLTFTEYKTAAPEMRQTLKEKVKRGERKSVGSVNRSLVSEQAYELSEEQGFAIFDFLRTNAEKYGIDFDYSNINSALMQIREGSWLREDVGIWDMIRDYRQELFDKGFSKEDVRNEVATTFFGSEPKKQK